MARYQLSKSFVKFSYFWEIIHSWTEVNLIDTCYIFFCNGQSTDISWGWWWDPICSCSYIWRCWPSTWWCSWRSMRRASTSKTSWWGWQNVASCRSTRWFCCVGICHWRTQYSIGWWLCTRGGSKRCVTWWKLTRCPKGSPRWRLTRCTKIMSWESWTFFHRLDLSWLALLIHSDTQHTIWTSQI